MQATKTNYRAGRIDGTTKDTYNFQDSTLRFKWKINAGGQYDAITVGTVSTYYFDPYPKFQGYYTTHHSWDGSEVISDNTWIFSEITFSEASYDYNMSYAAYGGTSFLAGSVGMTTTRWDLLADDSFRFRMGDNYYAGAYFELAEASIETSGDPVPEPATMLLFGTGLVGLVGSKLRKKKK